MNVLNEITKDKLSTLGKWFKYNKARARKGQNKYSITMCEEDYDGLQFLFEGLGNGSLILSKKE